MSEGFFELPVVQQEASLAGRDLRSRRAATDDSPTSMDELAHDLRQPLSVIETLAYYLEITSVDQKVCGHLRQIQAMVSQAHSILERSYHPAVTLT